MSSRRSRNGPVVVVTVLALLAAAGAGVYYFFNGGLLVSRSSRFYCQLRQDKSLGSDVYTVMYRHDKDRKPWLKMVSTLGGGFTPDKRCEEIARRLEIFRSDGLLELYSTLDTQLNQHLICARTKNSGLGCQLLVTLNRGADPDEELWRMSQSLIPGSNVNNNPQANISSSSESPTRDRSQPLVVDLRPFLSEEDRLAGEPAQ